MKLSTEKIRESLLSYFAKQKSDNNCENSEKLKLFRKKHNGKDVFLFAVELVGSDNEKIFLIWNPCTNEKSQVSEKDFEAEYLPEVPQEYKKEKYEGEFLSFTIRKRIGDYKFYLDFKNNHVFPRSAEEAWNKACAFLLTSESGDYWDIVWSGGICLRPVWDYGFSAMSKYGFPAYAAVLTPKDEPRYCDCLMVGINCCMGRSSEKLKLFEKENVCYVETQGVYVYFDGSDFLFRNRRYLPWEEARKRAEGFFADLEWVYYPESMRLAVVSVEGDALWLVGETKDHVVKILVDVNSAKVLSIGDEVFEQHYRIADADDERFV